MPQTYRQLQVWHRSKVLAVSVYRITAAAPLGTDFGLRDQLRRASVSICSNIAEGDARQTDKESDQFFFIAKGSTAEVSAQLEIARELHPAIASYADDLIRECEEISAMLQALIKHRRS